MQVYKEVAVAVQDLTDAERVAVTEGLAGKYHISRMQVLLDDLAKADSMYENMYESSVNSAHSAMNENEVYMQSLQARINLARVEIEKLSLAIGEAFLTEGMVQSIQIFSEFLQVLTNIIKEVGALPVLFGTLGVALVALSTRFRGLVFSFGLNSWRVLKGEIATTTVLTKAQTLAVSTLSKTWRGFLASTGVGLLFVGLGVGLEFLIGKMGDAKQEAEELESQQKQLMAEFTGNKEEIVDLANKYGQLQNAIGNNVDPNTEEYKKYLDVQNELAKLMPSLKTGEDEFGNAIIGSSSAVKAKIDLLNTQAEAQERVNEAQAKEDNRVKVEEANKTLTDSQDEMGKLLKSANNSWKSEASALKALNGIDLGFEDGLKNIDNVRQALANINKELLKQPEGSVNIPQLEYLRDSLVEIQDSMTITEASYSSAMATIKSSTIDTVTKSISSIKGFDKETRDLVENVSLSAISFSDSKEALDGLSELMGELGDKDDLKQNFADLSDTLVQMTEKPSKTMDEFSKNYGDRLNSIKESILKASELEKGSADYTALEQALNSLIKSQRDYMLEVVRTSKAEGISIEDAKAKVDALNEQAEATQNAQEKLIEYLAELRELESVSERMSGVSEQQVEDTDDLIYMYEILSKQQRELADGAELTANETEQLSYATETLSAIYPHLVQNGELRIDQIAKENEANKALQKAYDLASEGKLSAEQEMTLSSTQETKNRIENIKTEMKANAVLIKRYAERERTITSDSARSVEEQRRDRQEYIEALSIQAEKEKELNALIDSLSVSTGGLNQVITDVEEAEKKSNKTKKDSIYITDKYAQAIEELNTQIAKYDALQEEYPTHSSTYRKYLQEELKLLSKKKGLIEEQTKALEKQIKTGKIAQTGKITIDENNVKTSSSGASYKGNSNTDTIWNFFKSKGFSDEIVAGIMGNLKMESNFNPSALNKTYSNPNMQAFGIAQWLGGRKSALSNYASSVGTSMDNLSTQLEFLWKELNSTEKRTLNWINSNPNASASEMAKMFDKLFERSEGTHVPKRQQYANEILSSYGGKGATYATQSSVVSNTQESIDNAKSQLQSLKTELIDISSEIAQLEQEIINSQLESFTAYREKVQGILDYEDTKIQSLDTNNKRYNKTLQNQASYRQKLSASMEEEMKFIEGLINSGKLSAVTLEQMNIRTQELRASIIEMNLAIQDTNFALIQNIANNYDKDFDDLEYLISRSQAIAELFEEGSIDQKNEINNQIKLMNQELQLLEDKKKAIEADMKVTNLSVGHIEELEEQLEDLNVQYIQLKGSIKTATKQLEDYDKATKDNLKTIAEEVIEAYKSTIEVQKDVKLEALEEQKEATLDAIDEEIDAEKERHDIEMKNLDDELKKYQDIIDAKLQEIDREDSTRTYENELQDLQDERAELERQLQNLSFNNSFEGQAKRKELNEQIEGIDDEIQELQYQRGLELRQDNLNDMLELKEDEIEKETELEEEYHDEMTKKLEKKKEATEKALDEEIKYYEAYYNELLNDEKTFQELRQAVLDQNFTLIEDKFGGLITDLKALMPDFEFTVNGTWESVANTMRDTVIKELQDALDLIKKFKDEQSKLDTSVGNPLDTFSGSEDNGGLSEADMKVIMAKFMTEKIAPNESGARAKNIKEKAQTLAQEGRKANSKISSSQGINEIFDNLTSDELKQVGDYFKNNVADSDLITSKYTDYIKNYGEVLSKEQTLSKGDMQVLLAKYMKDILRYKTSDTNARNSIAETANNIAKNGRNNGSIISSSKGFSSIISTLSDNQLDRLGSFFTSNAGVVANTDLRDELLKYAKQIKTASLDVGGMTPNWSGTGVDGKGGRFAVLHPNEIINNPVDSKNLVKSVSIIDNIMRNILSSISLPTSPALSSSTNEVIRDISIVFQIDKMNGDKNDLDRFSKMVSDKLLREKGKR